MSSPVITPEPEPAPPRFGWAVRLLRWLGLLLLMAGVSLGTAFLIVELRLNAVATSVATNTEAELQTLRQETLDEVARLRAELATATSALEAQVREQQAALEADMKRVEDAAAAAGLLMEKDGNLTTLEARLAEVETLKLDLRTTREEMEAKLKALEESVKEQVASSEQETAAALSLEMTVKGLLIKAQGEVLLAQVHWAEGNRGLARDELTIAHRTLMDALAAAPAQAQPDLQKVVDLAESTKAALILDSTSARDQLNLLWHEVSARLSRGW
ncbi:hypothetical protein [Symbiobacterium terraclitae]|uniref:hypothetical protein n=1 Tax=Symbiobacterium terraclitae TaxID=557451 RepID=UPI0035B54D79